MAAEKGVSAAQVALAYVLNQPMNIFAVVGPHSVKKFQANIEASELHLTSREMVWLNLQSDSR